MRLDIPGFGRFDLKHLVLDFNGTLAADGAVSTSVFEKLRRLADLFTLHVLTADTFGTVAETLAPLGGDVKTVILQSDDHTGEKGAVVDTLGRKNCIAVGNGNNDALMLEYAAVGIAVINEEGCSVEAMRSADILCRSIDEALELLFEPRRIVATLRR